MEMAVNILVLAILASLPLGTRWVIVSQAR